MLLHFWNWVHEYLDRTLSLTSFWRFFFIFHPTDFWFIDLGCWIAHSLGKSSSFSHCHHHLPYCHLYHRGGQQCCHNDNLFAHSGPLGMCHFNICRILLLRHFFGLFSSQMIFIRLKQLESTLCTCWFPRPYVCPFHSCFRFLILLMPLSSHMVIWQPWTWWVPTILFLWKSFHMLIL